MRVLPDYNPLLEAVGTGESRANLQQSRANTAFDDRIMREALPITRFFDGTDGSINREEIANAGKGFTDPANLWDEVASNMPRGRGIDPVVFQQKVQAGQAMYDMNLANQVAQMGQSGYSAKQVWNAFGENPELRGYMVERGILEPQLKSAGMGSTAAFLGTMSAIQGGRAVKALSKTPKPTAAQISELKEAGYKYQKGGKNPGIKRMTAKDYYKADANIPKAVAKPTKPVTKDFKYKKGKSKGKTNTAAYNKAKSSYQDKLKLYKENRLSRLQSISSAKKAAKEAVKATKGQEVSRVGGAAIKQGAKSTTGKMATNMALRNVGKTLGARVGTGIGLRALGWLGGPWGLAATGAYSLYNLMRDQQDKKQPKSRWK